MNSTNRGWSRRDILWLAGFVVLTIAATWPVITNMRGVMFGFPGDTFDHVWMNWWYAQAWDSGVGWRHTDLIDAPVGKDFSELAMQPTWRWTGIALTKMGGEIFAFNFLVLATFFLSGAMMFYLARHVGAGRWAAFIAGAAYMLCPYHVWHSYQHLTLAAIQWMPLYALMLFRLRERPTVLRGVACGLVFALVMLENYWYGGFMLLVTALFVIVSLIWKARERARFSWRGILCAVVAVAVGAGAVAPWVVPIARHSLEGKEPLWPAMLIYQRTAEDAAAFAASPVDYVRPASNHAVWGNAFEGPQFAQEKTIYVGLVVFVMAVAGIASAGRGKALFPAVFLAAVVVVAFNMSLAPFAALGHSVAPMFRAYARLGVLVEMSLCALMAMGLNAIAMKARWGNVALVGIFALALLDFAYVPTKSVTDASKTPEVYEWLAKQPGDFIVTEIPTARFTNYDRFFQRVHHKRVLSNDRLDQVADLKSVAPVMFGLTTDRRELFRRYAARLAGYGVKYVIVHPRDPFQYNPVLQSFVEKGTDATFMWTAEEVERWARETGAMREVERFDDAVVYEVIAYPMKILIGSPDGRTLIIGPEESEGGREWFAFEILVQPGATRAVTAKIVFECNDWLEEFPGLTREGSSYLLSIPINEIETIVTLRPKFLAGLAPPPPMRVKIISFAIIRGE